MCVCVFCSARSIAFIHLNSNAAFLVLGDDCSCCRSMPVVAANVYVVVVAGYCRYRYQGPACHIHVSGYSSE